MANHHAGRGPHSGGARKADAGGLPSSDPASTTAASAASAKSGKRVESDADLAPMPHEVNYRNTVSHLQNYAAGVIFSANL